MVRWLIPLVVVALACAWVFGNTSRAQNLLNDSDTAVALRAIQARHDPMSWFRTDWPLGNHFYRPLPSLTLEYDLAVHGTSPDGFGVTNGIICVIGVLALYWAMSELCESLAMGAACAVLFSIWITDVGAVWGWMLSLAIVPLAALGIWRQRLKLRNWLPVLLALYYAAVVEVPGAGPGFVMNGDMNRRTLAWIPGRTATLMTVFALLAMALYARYERLGARRDPRPEPGPLDLPATRTSVQSPLRQHGGWPLAVGAWICVAAALACYEQAVMAPAALTGVAIILRARGLRVRVCWQFAFWALIPAYLLLRHVVLPPGLSGYQAQQLRHSTGPWIDMARSVFPTIGDLWDAWDRMTTEGFLVLMDTGVFVGLLLVASNIAGLAQISKRWPLAVGGLLLCLVTYMPMTWSKYFGHYGYWPSACRALFVVCLLVGVWEGVVIAVSPPARKAPSRPRPAPGSLPHP